MTSKIGTALRKLGHLDHFLFGTGSWSLKTYEERMIDAVIGAVEPNLADKMRRQLEQSFFVERASKNIHMLRFYSKSEALKIAGAEFEDRLFKVFMKLDGRKQTGRVTFYEGFFFSVEMPKPEKHYLYAQLEILGVEQGKPKDSLAPAIDRMEHGNIEESTEVDQS